MTGEPFSLGTPVGNYATQSDLVLHWSAVGVGKNSQTDPTLDSDTIDTASVAAAIEESEAEIDERFSSIYETPLIALSSRSLLTPKRWTCTLAMAWLVQKRPTGFNTDQASAIEAAKMQVDTEIMLYLAQIRQLNCQLRAATGPASTAPEVVL